MQRQKRLEKLAQALIEASKSQPKAAPSAVAPAEAPAPVEENKSTQAERNEAAPNNSVKDDSEKEANASTDANKGEANARPIVYIVQKPEEAEKLAALLNQGGVAFPEYSAVQNLVGLLFASNTCISFLRQQHFLDDTMLHCESLLS